MTDSTGLYFALPALVFSTAVVATYCFKNLPKLFKKNSEHPPVPPRFSISVIFAGTIGAALGFTVWSHWSDVELADVRTVVIPILTGAALEAIMGERKSSRKISAAVALAVGFLVAATG